MKPSNHWNPIAPSVGATPPYKLPKTAEDYLRAVGRRWWVVLLLTLAVGGAGAWFTLEQTPVYLAVSRVLIEPPRALMPGLVGDKASPAGGNFFNTRTQMIASREISDRVLRSREFAEWRDLAGLADPLATIQGWIEVKPVENSNLVDVMLEGTDPSTAAKLVNLVVEEFKRYEEQSLREFEQFSRSKIETELRNFRASQELSQKALSDFHKSHENYLSSGQSVEAARLEELEKAKTQIELRLDAAKRAVERFEALKTADIPYFSAETRSRADDVRSALRRIDEELAAQKELIKPEWYETDPAIRRLKAKRIELARSLETLGKDDADFELARLKQEHEFAAVDLDKIRSQVEQQRKLVLAQQGEREELERLRSDAARINSLADSLAKSKIQIEMHESLTTPRIQVIDEALPPTKPVRPIREIQIPLCFAAGLVLGLAIVLGLEFANQRVRRAEQASACLGLPLLGVVPRLSRRERWARRGALRLASEQPGARICEAFRNLRMGLLGAEGPERIRSLVVASPVAGEGKSLISANLASACARAGESVLLVDVDLRHPQLAKLLGVSAKHPGLVEVVAGEVPWRQAVQETQVPNLFVLGAGRAAGVPTDVLGTVEMHDLLAELCEEFDRVVLDGPPLLGLADSRAVGRFADGLLLVVQAALHDARPLARVRELCDHEGLRPMGVVFNGVRYRHEDLRATRPGGVRTGARRAPVVGCEPLQTPSNPVEAPIESQAA